MGTGFSKEGLPWEIGREGREGWDGLRLTLLQARLLGQPLRTSGWGPGTPTGPQVKEAPAAPGHPASGEIVLGARLQKTGVRLKKCTKKCTNGWWPLVS